MGELLREECGERLDDLQCKGLYLIQDPDKFCFGIDAVLLSNFVKVKKNGHVVDLCTGSGIVPILLSAKTGAKKITGIEIQSDIADMARRSVSYNKLDEKIDIINDDISNALKCKKSELVSKVVSLTDDIKSLEKELKEIKSQMALSSLDSFIAEKKEIDGISFIAKKVEFENQNDLRDLIDKLRDKLGTSVIVFANVYQGKLTFTVGVSKDLNARKINAGNIVREIAKLVGGNGGGRPDIASAGGKDLDKVDFALKQAEEILKSQF